MGQATSGKMQPTGEGAGEARRWEIQKRQPLWGKQCRELTTKGAMRRVSKGVKGFFKKAGENQGLWWNARRHPKIGWMSNNELHLPEKIVWRDIRKYFLPVMKKNHRTDCRGERAALLVEVTKSRSDPSQAGKNCWFPHGEALGVLIPHTSLTSGFCHSVSSRYHFFAWTEVRQKGRPSLASLSATHFTPTFCFCHAPILLIQEYCLDLHTLFACIKWIRSHSAQALRSPGLEWSSPFAGCYKKAAWKYGSCFRVLRI